MTPEEYREMQRRNREKEAKMTPEELAALNEVRRRHARRVRDEIITSYEIGERKKAEAEKKKNEEEE